MTMTPHVERHNQQTTISAPTQACSNAERSSIQSPIRITGPLQPTKSHPSAHRNNRTSPRLSTGEPLALLDFCIPVMLIVQRKVHLLVPPIQARRSTTLSPRLPALS